MNLIKLLAPIKKILDSYDIDLENRGYVKLPKTHLLSLSNKIVTEIVTSFVKKTAHLKLLLKILNIKLETLYIKDLCVLIIIIYFILLFRLKIKIWQI